MPELNEPWSWTPSADAPRSYAEVSRDFSPIHLDAELARREGLPGVILHGMHVFGQIVGALDRASQPGECLTRVAMRFADLTVPGEPVEVTSEVSHGAQQSSATVTFNAVQSGRTVLQDGRAEYGTGSRDYR